jgi:hypothetical protein
MDEAATEDEYFSPIVIFDGDNIDKMRKSNIKSSMK